MSTHPEDQTRAALALLRAYAAEDAAGVSALAPRDTPALTALWRADPIAAAHVERDEVETRALTHCTAAWAINLLEHEGSLTRPQILAALDAALTLPSA